MKISISYPPLESDKGIPLLGQNRQFQWFSEPTYIYPMVPAYAATLLQENGFEVLWDDAIAEGLTYADWLTRIKKEKPDVIAIETKTPVVKRHWKIIDDLKKQDGWMPLIVLMGDHVTALPEESMLNSKADFVLTGGDYDFSLLSLCKSLEPAVVPGPFPEPSAQSLVPAVSGLWYRQNGEIKNSGKYQLSGDLDSLPFIDRNLTKWELYAYKNGNFKFTPGTYMMSGRDCWWGRCSFCSWTTLFHGKDFRTRAPEKAVEEVGRLIELGVKEIMEDSGSLPIGRWLEDFCNLMIGRGYNKKIVLSCNMRINGIRNPEMWKLMKKAGFRFILFGLESANQVTLDRINKNLKAEEIEPALKMCKEAGLEPHITAMIGYPWETKEMTKRTIELAKALFAKGCVDTLQATIVIPYPGTPLYKECKENGWLATEDWDAYDQRKAVMRSPLSERDIKEFTQSLYRSFMNTRFIIRKIMGIKSWTDVKFLFKAGSKVLGHLMDFSPKSKSEEKTC